MISTSAVSVLGRARRVGEREGLVRVDFYKLIAARG